MGIFSGKSGVVAFAGAGAAIVATAAWFEFTPQRLLGPAPTPQTLVALPEGAPAAEDTAAAPQVASDRVTAPATPQALPQAQPEDAPEIAATPAAPPQDTPEPPQQAPEVEADDTPQPVQEAANIAPQAPSFDEVRRESDGMTVIAGQAEPGASISVLLDGSEVTSTTADSAGKFAAITFISPDGQGHILSLMQNGTQAEGQVILAPIDPVVVAVAEPEAELQAPAPEGTETAAPEPDTPPEETADAPSQVAENVAPAAEIAEVAPNAADAATPDTEVAEAAPEAPQAPAAPEEVAVLKTTDTGVELLNAPAPEVMSNVALDTISYSSAGEVQLAGRAQSVARSVRVYLNNNAVVSLSVDARGRWRGDLPDVDEGIYTLRVDEVAEDGSVTSRVETPFKRESLAVLTAATAENAGPISKVTVQKGATLWAIAEQRYGDGLLYVNVFKANAKDIRNPDLIYPGQVFDLPD